MPRLFRGRGRNLPHLAVSLQALQQPRNAEDAAEEHRRNVSPRPVSRFRNRFSPQFIRSLDLFLGSSISGSTECPRNPDSTRSRRREGSRNMSANLMGEIFDIYLAYRMWSCPQFIFVGLTIQYWSASYFDVSSKHVMKFVIACKKNIAIIVNNIFKLAVLQTVVVRI